MTALKRIFERKSGSDRRFRHEIYAYIAEHEPEVWALCGTAEQRESATKDPALERGSHAAALIVKVWDHAMKEACGGFEFGKKVTGSKNPEMPNGYWTTEIVFI